MTEALRIERTADGVRLVGDLDHASASVLTDALAVISDTVHAVHLSGLRFVDSSGLRALTRVHRDLPGVRMTNPRPAVARLMELTGLTFLLHEREPAQPGALRAETRLDPG